MFYRRLRSLRNGIFHESVVFGEQHVSEQMYGVIGIDLAVAVKIRRAFDGIRFGEQYVSEQKYGVVGTDDTVGIVVAGDEDVVAYGRGLIGKLDEFVSVRKRAGGDFPAAFVQHLHAGHIHELAAERRGGVAGDDAQYFAVF